MSLLEILSLAHTGFRLVKWHSMDRVYSSYADDKGMTWSMCHLSRLFHDIPSANCFSTCCLACCHEQPSNSSVLVGLEQHIRLKACRVRLRTRCCKATQATVARRRRTYAVRRADRVLRLASRYRACLARILAASSTLDSAWRAHSFSRLLE